MKGKARGIGDVVGGLERHICKGFKDFENSDPLQSRHEVVHMPNGHEGRASWCNEACPAACFLVLPAML